MTSGVPIGKEEKEAKKAAALEYLMGSVGGTFSHAFKHAAIPTSIAYLWLDEDKDWKEKMVTARKQSDQSGGDYAESQLQSAIKNMNITAIIFYLKCKHKDRGFIDRQEITGKDAGPVEINHTGDAVDGFIAELAQKARQRTE